MNYLEIKNNKYYGCDTEEFHPPFNYPYCRELIRIDTIIHVYIVMDERTSICIEYLNYEGNKFNAYETFDTVEMCNARFYEIERILNRKGDFK